MTTPNQTELSPLDEDRIAAYLLQTPAFFERYASVLASVQLPSLRGGQQVISLHERQADLLRERMRAQEQRVSDMARYAHQNEQIAQKVHNWSCEIAATAQPRMLPSVIAQGIEREFDVPQVTLRVWDVAAAYGGSTFTMGASADSRAFASSLTMPFCGPNLGFEPTHWLPNPQEIQSVALLPLREGANESPTPAFGLLVLGSGDPHRFEATMGTEFLSRIAELASAALQRLRVPPSV